LLSRKRNTLNQSEFFRDLINEEPLKLMEGDVKIWSTFITPDFNNDDSEFAEIRLHYTEANGSDYKKEEVPMIECDIDLMTPEGKNNWYPGTTYCPDW